MERVVADGRAPAIKGVLEGGKRQTAKTLPHHRLPHGMDDPQTIGSSQVYREVGNLACNFQATPSCYKAREDRV